VKEQVMNAQGFATAWNCCNDMPAPVLPGMPKEALKATFKGGFEKILVQDKRRTMA
jgi:hypothetical protein